MSEVTDLNEAGTHTEIQSGAKQDIDEDTAPEQPADRIDDCLKLLHVGTCSLPPDVIAGVVYILP